MISLSPTMSQLPGRNQAHVYSRASCSTTYSTGTGAYVRCQPKIRDLSMLTASPGVDQLWPGGWDARWLILELMLVLGPVNHGLGGRIT